MGDFIFLLPSLSLLSLSLSLVSLLSLWCVVGVSDVCMLRFLCNISMDKKKYSSIISVDFCFIM